MFDPMTAKTCEGAEVESLYPDCKCYFEECNECFNGECHMYNTCSKVATTDACDFNV